MTRIKDAFVTIPRALRLLELVLVVELIDSTLLRAHLMSHGDDAQIVFTIFALKGTMSPLAMGTLRGFVAGGRNFSARAAMLSATVRFICALELPTPDDLSSGPRLMRRLDLARLSMRVGDLEPC